MNSASGRPYRVCMQEGERLFIQGEGERAGYIKVSEDPKHLGKFLVEVFGDVAVVREGNHINESDVHTPIEKIWRAIEEFHLRVNRSDEQKTKLLDLIEEQEAVMMKQHPVISERIEQAVNSLFDLVDNGDLPKALIQAKRISDWITAHEKGNTYDPPMPDHR